MFKEDTQPVYTLNSAEKVKPTSKGLKGLSLNNIIRGKHTMVRTTPPEQQLNMDNFKITERKGHHEPNGQRRHHARCGCKPSTSSGYAYRDKVAERTGGDKEETWDRIRFYHQSPVVKKNADVVEVNTHGHGRNSTTRERINKELPHGFKIRQKDFEVKLELPNGDLMDIPEQFQIVGTNETIRNNKGETLMEYTRET